MGDAGDAIERRFIRVTRGSIVGGIHFGMFTAAFYGLQNLLAEEQGVHDIYNVVGAGSATATFGLIMRGSPCWCLRNLMLGSVLGAAICFPIGWLHLKGNCLLTCEGSDTVEEKSGIGAWVELLEGNLNK
ncbi:UNVERIFIED_CONTAM: hypothetical protein Scaly_2541300 [Sesamum calycinum]|uniref:Complex I assembly factor TIMMDC1, mitochondrial n=1 Tax=Sesamum calycinum TaxID=2727403 RepID=A0AAW2JBL1_9LAMI